MELITEETINIEKYINQTWPKFQTKKEQPLKELFPEPENRSLKNMWRHGSADLVIRKSGKIICIIEPGGSQHFTDEKQIKNDKKKYIICKNNGVGCLKVANGVVFSLSKRQRRKMLGKFLFPNPI